MLLGVTVNAQVLPNQKSISDKKGRTIEGAILAIEKDHIVFKKTNDDKELNVPRKSLSEEDQKYVGDLENFILHDVGVEFFTIGSPGNDNNPKADPKTGNKFGKVDYIYEIGKYPVTNEQYAKFLNAKAKADPYGLYDERMNEHISPGNGVVVKYGIVRSGSEENYQYSVLDGYAQKAVGWIEWFRAARFCNWMSNGQGDADTETGSYTLDRKSKGFIPVNDKASVRLPTENEWYKAAYYNHSTSAYSIFPGEDLQQKTEQATSFYGCVYPAGTERIDDLFESDQTKKTHQGYRTCRGGVRGADKRFYDIPGILCNAGGAKNIFRIVRIDSNQK